MSFEEWQQVAAAYAETELGLDIWATDDPYELGGVAADAFNDGQSPEDFINEVFAEDFARQAHDADLHRESLEYED